MIRLLNRFAGRLKCQTCGHRYDRHAFGDECADTAWCMDLDCACPDFSLFGRISIPALLLGGLVGYAVAMARVLLALK